jgi:adenine deaminase
MAQYDPIQDKNILDLQRKISLAKGQERVDLLVKNAKIINVFSGEIHETDVAIADGIFVGFGEGYDAKKNMMHKENLCVLDLLMDISI